MIGQRANPCSAESRYHLTASASFSGTPMPLSYMRPRLDCAGANSRCSSSLSRYHCAPLRHRPRGTPLPIGVHDPRGCIALRLQPVQPRTGTVAHRFTVVLRNAPAPVMPGNEDLLRVGHQLPCSAWRRISVIGSCPSTQGAMSVKASTETAQCRKYACPPTFHFNLCSPHKTRAPRPGVYSRDSLSGTGATGSVVKVRVRHPFPGPRR